MSSLILSAVSKGIVPIASLFALFLLLRGHNEPGGGFAAGLVLGIAIWLQALAFGPEETKARLARKVRPALPVGLALAAASGLFSMPDGKPFLTHQHWEWPSVSTALFFELGVFLVVVGTVAILTAAFAEVLE